MLWYLYFLFGMALTGFLAWVAGCGFDERNPAVATTLGVMIMVSWIYAELKTAAPVVEPERAQDYP